MEILFKDLLLRCFQVNKENQKSQDPQSNLKGKTVWNLKAYQGIASVQVYQGISRVKVSQGRNKIEFNL